MTLISARCARIPDQPVTGIFSGEILPVRINENPGRLLCSIDDPAGYNFLFEGKGYRSGIGRKD